jgi:hypothetical protein
MFDALNRWTDRLLGRGSAAISVPVMDGALKPNRGLDEAEQVASLAGIDDLASDGRYLFAIAGAVLYRLDGAALIALRRFDTEITALALSRDGLLAIALGGHRVQVLSAIDGTELAKLAAVDGQQLQSVNALAFDSADRLLISDGSTRRGPAQWCHDLMELGASGRVMRWSFRSGSTELLAAGQHYAFGVLTQGDAVLHSESWRHRIVRTGPAGRELLVTELPGYPSRMAAAADGGFWLSCFVCRTQLVEFVLREPAYRQRMMAEIDPRHWIAPALSSGHSFLEPLQGASVKQMGVLKPWAPPRSYGLVLKLAADGRIEHSLHSQVDGQHHGITALAEFGGALYVASKGSGHLLRIDLAHPKEQP